MTARTELADALVECLAEVTSSLETALAVSLQQRDALVDNDTDAVATASVSQQDILRKIAQADERAAAVATMIAEETGLDAAKADTSEIAKATGPVHEARISREINRTSDLARKLRDANETNAHLLRNGLEVIASCLKIIVRRPEPVVYSRSASLGASGGGILALDSRV